MRRPPSLSVLLFLLSLVAWVSSHEESGDWSCDSSAASDIGVDALFLPGIVALDGRADDWVDVEGSEFSLLPALDPDDDKAYAGGKMTALHDGKDVFFLLQVDGDCAYSKGENTKCPSVALMFQIGESATYHDMGGCKEGRDTCTNKTCKGHEVDIMHFSIGNAIPGRLYGGNPIDNGEGNGGDRFGHLVDLYAWTPHCIYLDGIGPSGNDTSAQNNWNGAWWHSSLSLQSGFIVEDSPYSSNGTKGTYYFEFSRPLRTMDRLQQDAQFRVGGTAKMSAAFWYPDGGNAWHRSGHYSINCEWIQMDISSGKSVLAKAGSSGSSWDAASAFSLLFSDISLCLSVFIAYRMFGPGSSQYKPMEISLG